MRYLSNMLTFLFCSIISLYAQTKDLDSLLLVCKNRNNPDSVRLKALILYLKSQDSYDSTYKALLDTANSWLNSVKIDSFYIGLYYNTLGLYLYYTDDYDSARKVLQKAANIFKSLGKYKYVGISYGNLGNTYCAEADFTTCVKYLLKAQDYFYRYKDTNYIIVGEINLGAVYSSLNDTGEALRRYKLAYNLANKFKDNHLIGVSSRNLAYIYLDLNFIDSARFYINQALKYAKLSKSKSLLADAFYQSALLYLKIKELDSVYFYAKKALNIYETIDNKFAKSLVYLILSKYYTFQRQYDSAYKYGYLALELSKSINSKENIRDSYLQLFRIDSITGAYKQALFNFIKYKQYSDSILSLDKQIAIKNLETKFILKLKEEENKLLRLKEKQHSEIIKRQRVILLLSLIIVLGLILFLVYHLKMDKKITERTKQLIKYKEDIEDSLQYAALLQKSLLPDLSILSNFFTEWFLFYKPKEIVSGDFYWVRKLSDNKIIIIVGDCTGHGVPGAMLSVLTITLLIDSIKEISEFTAAQALNIGREKIKSILMKNNIGLDVALLIYDKSKQEINFAGAYRPICIIHNKQLVVLKGDRQPLAAYIKEREFTDHYLSVKKGDMIYLFTDGFPDLISPQYGKLTTGRFKNIILEIHHLPAAEQKEYLENFYKHWLQDYKQTDDITILGLRV